MPLLNVTYDGTICGALQDPGPTVRMRDTSYDVNFVYRGNPTSTTKMGATTCTAYQITGVPYKTQDGAGRTVNLSSDNTTNFSLPAVLTPNGNSNLATSITYSSSFAVTSVTGPNGATSSTNYDQYGRPQSSVSSDGASTAYTYTYNPNVQTATISTTANGTTTTQWKKTTLDGFGRTVTEQTGHDGTTVTQVDTQYAPCACSPLGKLSAVSLPHVPGATAIYTIYTYDGSGRTLTVTKPDGTSVTRYDYLTSATDPVGNVYTGSLTRITDPAGKWKIQQSDSFGNLIRVLEPNPDNVNGAAWLVTNYTYNGANQLTQVQMPRVVGGQSYTQTRTFQYSGTDLTSATNPENGTVTYQYDGAHHVTQRIDAKGQKTVYNYDAYGRLTLTQHWAWKTVNGNTTLQEDPAQDVNYYYDFNPFVSGFSQNAWGRLTAVTFAPVVADQQTGSLAPSMYYMYSYNQAGRVTTQRMRYAPGGNPGPDFDASYAWDNQGRMTSMGYPHGGPAYSYQFDTMGRLSTMTSQGSTIGAASYNALGQLSSIGYDGTGIGFGYNSLMQLTQEVGGQMNMQYVYPAHNNGRISQAIDGAAGETVNYTYDALNRLSTATAGTWSQAYTYDGYGNLTGTNGAAVWSFDPTAPRGDANGLPTNGGVNGWDVENRLTMQWFSGGYTAWTYDPYGKRVMKDGNLQSGVQELYFYGIDGRRLMTISCGAGFETSDSCGAPSYNLYFKGRLIRSKGVTVVTDRLGSVRGTAGGERMSYLPYGQERTSTADNREKFGTYFRDGAGQDYADQRYYNQAGSFWTPDPGGIRTADPGNPGSWNRYAYVQGDPINFRDPHGLIAEGTFDCVICGNYEDGDGEDNQGGGKGGSSSDDDMQVTGGGGSRKDTGGGGGAGGAGEAAFRAQWQRYVTAYKKWYTCNVGASKAYNTAWQAYVDSHEAPSLTLANGPGTITVDSLAGLMAWIKSQGGLPGAAAALGAAAFSELSSSIEGFINAYSAYRSDADAYSQDAMRKYIAQCGPKPIPPGNGVNPFVEVGGILR